MVGLSPGQSLQVVWKRQQIRVTFRTQKETEIQREESQGGKKNIGTDLRERERGTERQARKADVSLACISARHASASRQH